MELEVFGIIVLLAGIGCQLLHFRWCVIAMFAFAAFGGSAAVTFSSLGGASITPANLFLPFYALRLLSDRIGLPLMLAELAPNRPMFPFLLLTVWAALSGFFLPRLFDGQMNVFSLNRFEELSETVPLHPTTGNITQAVYAIGAFLTALTTCCFCRKEHGYRAVLQGIVAVSTIDIVFAILDATSGATGVGPLFGFLRTGGYKFLTEGDIAGVKRITGLMPEASAFAAFSLLFFAANFVLFTNRIRMHFTGPASILLGLLIAGSTATSGYIGLSAFFLLYGFYALFALGAFYTARPLAIVCGLVIAAFLGFCFLMIAAPNILATAQDVITTVVFEKAASDSAMERGSWNSQAWLAFTTTYGVGIGIGSTRSSNYALVLLSNLGALGFLLFAVVIVRAVLGRVSSQHSRQERALLWAARAGIMTELITSLAIGTVYDKGAAFYCLLGLCLSYSVAPRRILAPQVRRVATNAKPIAHAGPRPLAPGYQAR